MIKNPTDGVLSATSLVLQMKCSTAVERKNAICWISKYDFRLAGSQKTLVLLNVLKDALWRKAKRRWCYCSDFPL